MNTESDTDTDDKEGRGREEEEWEEKEGGTGGWETLEGGRPCQGRGVEPTEKGRVKGGGGGNWCLRERKDLENLSNGTLLRKGWVITVLTKCIQVYTWGGVGWGSLGWLLLTKCI